MQIFLKQRSSVFVAPVDVIYPYIILQWDNWNDFSYSTFFVASIVQSATLGHKINVGGVKIQKLKQTKADYSFARDLVGPFELADFDVLYCSLGASMSYYEALRDLDDTGLAIRYLKAMCDAAFDIEIRNAFQDDDCFQISLLRESEARRALDEGGKLFGIDTNLVNSFSAEIKLPGANAPHVFDFDFSPFRGLPHRLHALVGLNGVGKTQVMARLAMLMSRFSRKTEKEGRSTLETEGSLSTIPSIYNVVAISFSAFDEFERPTTLQGEKFRYSYCGLRSHRGRLLTEDDLLENIRRIVTDELDEEKRSILASVLTQIIRVDNIQSFVEDHEGHKHLYERLSAGQRIALNALCHTLAKLEPRTLVLFDEPELHLHPQLLATMTTAFSDLLNRYDSFAILATHSPIVIQQIPSKCVHIVRRDRMTPMVLKPRFESFGETITEITRNVFLSTESDRDYRNTLDRLLLENNYDLDAVEEIFENKLSMNARVYLESRRTSVDEG